jgi:prephenate dehydrogenase
MFPTLTIIGVGLIGGSLGLAVRKHKVAHRVIGVGRNRHKLDKALDLGALDECTTDIYRGVREADLVVVCTPVESIIGFVQQAALNARPKTLITDAGSTKELIVKQVEADLKKHKSPVDFVGSHPMAGSEKNGAEHSRADLFEGRAVIVTPGKRSSPDAVERIHDFWRAVGANVLQMSPAEHDRAVAAISHVPHVVASALAAATPEESLPLAAGGWFDTTRIAAADVELWRQILAQNRGHVLKALAQFEKVLSGLRAALESENDAKLLKILQAGKNIRDAVGSRHPSG